MLKDDRVKQDPNRSIFSMDFSDRVGWCSQEPWPFCVPTAVYMCCMSLLINNQYFILLTLAILRLGHRWLTIIEPPEERLVRSMNCKTDVPGSKDTGDWTQRTWNQLHTCRWFSAQLLSMPWYGRRRLLDRKSCSLGGIVLSTVVDLWMLGSYVEVWLMPSSMFEPLHAASR